MEDRHPFRAGGALRGKEKVKLLTNASDVWGGEADLVFNVSARKIVRKNSPMGMDGMSDQARSVFLLSQEACWAEVYFADSYEALNIDTKDVSTAFNP